MNGTNYVSSKSIVYDNGTPALVHPSQFRVVGVGKFGPSPNFPAAPPPPCIVWQNVLYRYLAIWYLKKDGPNAASGDYVKLDTTALLAPGLYPEGLQALAVGNFDGSGSSDIALQTDDTGVYRIWLMNGLDIASNTWGYTGGCNWRISGTGDFGSASDVGSGQKDCRDDIVLTFYDPVNDTTLPRNNFGGLWFLNASGTYFQTGAVIGSGNQNYILDTPDWRAVATGNFNQDTTTNQAGCSAPTGATDVLFRDMVIGRHGYWYLKGREFQGGYYGKTEPDPIWRLYSQDLRQSTWRHKDLFPTATASTSVNGSTMTVTLNYRIKPVTFAGSSVGITVKRRIPPGTAWTTLPGASVTETSATDSGLTASTTYEYEISRTGIGNGYNGYYAARMYVTGTGAGAAALAARGKVLVIVDQDVYGGIGTSLQVFTNDLIGDGWYVEVKVDAPRHIDSSVEPTECASEQCTKGCCPPSTCPPGSTPCVITPKRYATTTAADTSNKNNSVALRDWITNPANNDAKGVILIGHVVIPYSGQTDAVGWPWDGHSCEHGGAWVADAWYGHTGVGWNQDTSAAAPCAVFAFNSNRANDGKFDNSFIPDPQNQMKKFVGRIDFARLPIFGTGNDATLQERNLINQYFLKNHAYRFNQTRYASKCIAYAAFDLLTYTNEVTHHSPYEHAFRTITPLAGSGADRIVVGHSFHRKTDSFLWGFLGGFGAANKICESAGYATEGNFLEYNTAKIQSEPEARVAFYMLLGSYFGDWNMNDDLMRAALARPTHGLASVWTGKQKLRWQFQSLAAGEPLGHGFLETIRDPVPSPAESEYVPTWLSILGDPTLRANPLTPPEVDFHYAQGTAYITAGEPGCAYYLYHSPVSKGPYTYHTGPFFTDTAMTVPIPTTGYTMVRAAKTITTGSATYLNLSQGVF